MRQVSYAFQVTATSDVFQTLLPQESFSRGQSLGQRIFGFQSCVCPTCHPTCLPVVLVSSCVVVGSWTEDFRSPTCLLVPPPEILLLLLLVLLLLLLSILDLLLFLLLLLDSLYTCLQGTFGKDFHLPYLLPPWVLGGFGSPYCPCLSPIRLPPVSTCHMLSLAFHLSRTGISTCLCGGSQHQRFWISRL